MSPNSRNRALALTLGSLLAAPAALAGGRAAVPTTYTLKDAVAVFPANVCGVDYTVTETANVVIHVTDFTDTPNPMDHVEGTDEGGLVMVPNDSSLPTYTGRDVAHFSGNTNPNTDGFTQVLQIQATGEDGSILKVKLTQHVTTVDGILIVDVEHLDCF
jgi:hypothetical protein